MSSGMFSYWELSTAPADGTRCCWPVPKHRLWHTWTPCGSGDLRWRNIIQTQIVQRTDPTMLISVQVGIRPKMSLVSIPGSTSKEHSVVNQVLQSSSLGLQSCFSLYSSCRVQLRNPGVWSQHQSADSYCSENKLQVFCKIHFPTAAVTL